MVNNKINDAPIRLKTLSDHRFELNEKNNKQEYINNVIPY